jgi:hypothetical protein
MYFFMSDVFYLRPPLECEPPEDECDEPEECEPPEYEPDERDPEE